MSSSISGGSNSHNGATTTLRRRSARNARAAALLPSSTTASTTAARGRDDFAGDNDPYAPSSSSLLLSSSSSSNRFNKLAFLLGLVLMVAPWFYHSSLNWTILSLREDILVMQDKQDGLLRDIRTWTGQLDDLKRQSKPLEDGNDALLQKLRAVGDTVDTDSNQYRQAEQQENAYLDRIEQLEETIQRRSVRDVTLRYGEGPYRINVTLTEGMASQQGNGGAPDNHRWFVIETAPTSLMPHAVDLFTRMAVDYKLYDGLTLLVPHHGSDNAESSLLHTVALSATTYEYLDKHFEASVPNLVPKLAFAEHSDRYPIEKYSVAFAGRPGGPHFYINLLDDDDESARSKQLDMGEACFGKVVEGRHVFDWIIDLHKKAGQNKDDFQPRRLLMYGIETMKLIPNEE